MSTLIKHLRKLSKDEKTAYYYDIVGEHQHESVTISKISLIFLNVHDLLRIKFIYDDENNKQQIIEFTYDQIVAFYNLYTKNIFGKADSLTIPFWFSRKKTLLTSNNMKLFIVSKNTPDVYDAYNILAEVKYVNLEPINNSMLINNKNNEIQKQYNFDINSNTLTQYIDIANSNMYVKEILWFYKNDQDEYLDVTNDVTSIQIVDGDDNKLFREPNYYKYVQPLQHHTKVPIDNFYLYSFVPHPEDYHTNMDSFGILDADKLNLFGIKTCFADNNDNKIKKIGIILYGYEK